MAARRRRMQNLYVYGGGVALVAIIALVIYLNIRSSAPAGEEEVIPTQGNTHIQQGSASPIEYNTTPPTSEAALPGVGPLEYL